MRTIVILSALAVCLAATPVAAASSGTGGGVHGDGSMVGGTTIAVRTAASPIACNDEAYSFINPSTAWASTLEWKFRSSSVPANLDSADTLATIRKAFRNITNSRNSCGMADQVSATHSYLGTTSRRPNVTQAGACGSPDGHSVVGFGNLNGYYAGYTCIWWNGFNHITEADMRLDPEEDWWIPGDVCSNGLSMEGLVTHEVGHAYGLGHVGENRHGRLTMSVYIDGTVREPGSGARQGRRPGLRQLY